MNFILKFLSTSGKEMMAKMISTDSSAHPLRDDIIYHEDQAYEGADGVALAADVYLPRDKPAGLLPIVMFVHGGGLFVGDRKAYRVFSELVAERGYLVVVPQYRLIDKTDAFGEISDVCAGLSFVKNHAAEFGGDLSRVLVIGESAGAFLSLFAIATLKSPLLQETFGIKAPELTVSAFASFGGMLYTNRFDLLGLVYRRDLYGERRHDPDFMALMDPSNPRVELNLPPVFQVTSEADFLGSYTLRFNNELTSSGHDHRLIYYKDGKELKHAFPSLQPGLPESKQVLRELDAWFKKLCSQLPPDTSPSR